MNIDAAFQGSLFASDFLCDSVAETPDWQGLDHATLDALEAALRTIFDGFPFAGAPNESQTEDDLIWPVLRAVGWSASLRQQNLSARGREDVPDGLLFADEAAKGRANALAQEWRRYEHGLAVVESKRWQRPLDRRSGRAGEETAPSTQMLRYLRRVDDLTTGKLRNGALSPTARAGGSIIKARARCPSSFSRSISRRSSTSPATTTASSPSTMRNGATASSSSRWSSGARPSCPAR